MGEPENHQGSRQPTQESGDIRISGTDENREQRTENRGPITRTRLVVLVPVLLSVLCSLFSVLPAQGPRPYPIHALDHVAFLERLNTTVTTHTGGADLHRAVSRDAVYLIALHGDTLHVSGDSLVLSETLNSKTRTLNTDGFVGGAWDVLLDPQGGATIEASPFVPLELLDVSNVGLAMDDFFPPRPPVLFPKATMTDSVKRSWTRLADSAGLQHYIWTSSRETTRTDSTGSSAVEAVHEVVREDSDLLWDAERGPMSWRRHFQVTAASKVAGRTLIAEIEQRIVVTRLH